MLDTQLSVAETVLSHSSCAPVFQRHKIDFCCRGHLSIAEAAEDRHVELSSLVAELEAAIDHRGPVTFDARKLSTPALIAHIIGRHHAYLREAMPFILHLADKVARVHGSHNPRLPDLARHVHAIAGALMPHLDQEEQVLFPALMGAHPDRELVARELAAMVEDHLLVGSLLAQIREAADEFTFPEWACNSYRTLFAELENMETDILTHVHLENHALMGRFQPQEPA